MPKNEQPDQSVDWSLATWDGSRREALRRWAQLPLERVIAALEEMQELNDMLSESPAAGKAVPRPGAGSAVHEPHGDYRAKPGTHPGSLAGRHADRQPRIAPTG